MNRERHQRAPYKTSRFPMLYTFLPFLLYSFHSSRNAVKSIRREKRVTASRENRQRPRRPCCGISSCCCCVCVCVCVRDAARDGGGWLRSVSRCECVYSPCRRQYPANQRTGNGNESNKLFHVFRLLESFLAHGSSARTSRAREREKQQKGQ